MRTTRDSPSPAVVAKLICFVSTGLTLSSRQDVAHSQKECGKAKPAVDHRGLHHDDSTANDDRRYDREADGQALGRAQVAEIRNNDLETRCTKRMNRRNRRTALLPIRRRYSEELLRVRSIVRRQRNMSTSTRNTGCQRQLERESFLERIAIVIFVFVRCRDCTNSRGTTVVLICTGGIRVLMFTTRTRRSLLVNTTDCPITAKAQPAVAP